MPYELPQNVGRPSAAAVGFVRKFLGPLTRLVYRPAIQGLDKLPMGRPFLLVANHSAGIAVAEITSFASLYVERFGVSRPLTGFAHPTGFRVWPLTAIHRHLGSIPSTYEAADAALAAGVPILIFPGGDYEALRPICDAHRVDFGGRLGFLKIARRHRISIVPMGIRGSHFTVPILVRSKLIANALVVPRLLGTKRWGVSLLGLLGAAGLLATTLHPAAKLALTWLWLGSPLVFWPIVPWPIRFRIGEPLQAEDLFTDDAESAEQLQRASDRVTSTIQQLVER